MSLEQIASIVAILTPIIGGLAWLYRRRSHQLRPEEKEILTACAETGELWILTVNVYGDWLRSGKVDFFRQEDRAYQARYLEAFTKLRDRGFAEHVDGILYRLTGTGFAVARKCKGNG